MESCNLFDCEWGVSHPGVIVDGKVYVLDEANQPTAVSRGGRTKSCQSH